MTALIKSLLAPLLSIILAMLSSGFFFTFLSVRLKTDGFPETTIGYVHSAYYAGLLLCSWRFETLLYRIGHIRSFAAAAAIATATILLQGIIIDPKFWILMRFFNGMCIASVFIVIESWLLAKSTFDTRGRILSIYMIALYASQMTGQFIIDFVDIYTLASFLVAGILCALSAVPLSLTYTESPETEEHSMKGLFSLFRISPFGVIGCFLSGMILSAIYSFVPNFAQTHHLSVALITSVTIAGGFILQWPIGHLSDLFDRHKLLIILSLCNILPAIALIMLPKEALPVSVLSFILGGFCFTIYPVSIAHVCDRVRPEHIITTTSVLMLAYAVGAVLGPLIAPPFMLFLSTDGLYLYIALCSGVLALFGLYSLWKKPAILFKDQSEYVALPNLTSVAYELDPRSTDDDEETMEPR